MLTIEEKEEYIKKEYECPYCKKHNIEFSSMDDDADTSTSFARCKSCGKRWRNTYVLQLSGMDEEEELCDGDREYLNDVFPLLTL
jgi:transcription elongation factor Elf1